MVRRFGDLIIEETGRNMNLLYATSKFDIANYIVSKGLSDFRLLFYFFYIYKPISKSTAVVSVNGTSRSLIVIVMGNL